MLAYLSNLINLRKRGAYRTKENMIEQPDQNKYRIQLERDFWNTKRTSLRGKYRERHHQLSNNNLEISVQSDTQVYIILTKQISKIS